MLPDNASLQLVSRKFQLNKKQHKAFVRIWAPFLRSVVCDGIFPQVTGFIGGGPGCGKSQVIRALQAIAASWNCEDAVKTVAYQGVAAEAANGQTIHKLFQWGVKSRSRPKRYSAELKEKFAKLNLLIIDEISTTDAKIIGMIDSALRDLKSQPNLRFGGVRVLFVGDWLQQLPVAGHPALVNQPQPPIQTHSSNSACDDATITYLQRQRGIQAYRKINEVIILEEVCEYYPILITSNALRVEFNNLASIEYCMRTGEIMHNFPAIVSHARFQLSRGQRRSMVCIRSDKSAGLPILQVLSMGLPMQCTKNMSRALHLANGTIGTVAGFQPSDGDNVRVVGENDIVAHYHFEPAAVVLLRHSS
ncbi:hypothetical protein PHMEG_00032146 [Phytophthora megakarya]|uniref:ATP-dependent DNA helicase n=1 Tax=Phytophthora megakarya TaxID=4795 RepID=A0A225UW78_9STRA|nr:hypothetical protein PHMEG_00032146 [Phytophthora megakarya]